VAEALVTTLASWDSEGVTLDQVQTALSELRSHEQKAAVRTSVLTLVAVVGDESAADAAADTMRQLEGRHPSRTVVILIDRDSDAAQLDAKVSVQAVERNGRTMCFEEITLNARGRVRSHLDSLIEPLTLPDVPVVVWLPNWLPAPGDPLLDTADRLVVDTRAIGERPDLFVRVARLMRRLPVSDLSWARLRFWRAMLAGTFEGTAYLPFLNGIDDVEVSGNFGPRHMVGGWLMATLDVPRGRVHVDDARHVRIRVDAHHDGHRGRFIVDRPTRERVLQATVEIDGGPSLHQTLNMPRRWPGRALSECLAQTGPDPVYGEALHGALTLLSEGAER
jgi:glucose-6-phosphate dehydrogenase assembly protein OpcA